MNERIQALIEEAWITIPHERDWDATSTFFDKVKFAELIVRECVSLRTELSQFDGSTAYGDGYENGLKDLAETIKEHFGVDQ